MVPVIAVENRVGVGIAASPFGVPVMDSTKRPKILVMTMVSSIVLDLCSGLDFACGPS